METPRYYEFMNAVLTVLGGRVSLVPWQSQVRFQAHIPGSRLEVFEEHEVGNHHMLAVW